MRIGMIRRSSIEDLLATLSEPTRLAALGIVIDGKVVHAGGLPKTDDLQRWLQA